MKTMIISALFALIGEISVFYLHRGLDQVQELYAIIGLLLFAGYTVYQKVTEPKKRVTSFSLALIAGTGAWLILTPFRAPSTWWQEELGVMMKVNALSIEKWTFFMSFAAIILAVNYCAGMIVKGLKRVKITLQRRKKSLKEIKRRQRNHDTIVRTGVA